MDYLKVAVLDALEEVGCKYLDLMGYHKFTARVTSSLYLTLAAA